MGVVLRRFLRKKHTKSTASAIHKIPTTAPRTPPTMATTVLELFKDFELEGLGREEEEVELGTADASAVLELLGEFELEGFGRGGEEEAELGIADASAVLEDGLVSEFVGFGNSDVLMEVDAAKTG